MRIFVLIFSTLLLIPLAVAQENSCFPVGSAVHDRECYDFDNQSECQKTDDIYSCGWGKRSPNHVSDDDQLICEEDQRCRDAIDDEEELED